NIFPSIADLMTYMKGLRPRNLIGAAFGSYGWSGEAVKQLNAILEAMKVDVVHEGIRVKWVPTQEDLAQCRELGEMVGKMLVDTCDGA
ncbi:MAG TPA: FprA family A-type flavoprotein, partial [Armatimonadota bacterium]|nr:FprA family A-type flavoprotein [Armatimonadota bacterium]